MKSTILFLSIFASLNLSAQSLPPGNHQNTDSLVKIYIQDIIIKNEALEVQEPEEAIYDCHIIPAPDLVSEACITRIVCVCLPRPVYQWHDDQWFLSDINFRMSHDQPLLNLN